MAAKRLTIYQDYSISAQQLLRDAIKFAPMILFQTLFKL